ncbi:surface antigen (D15) [Novosphingobium aromaticivorans DSM 12444]|uniref:Outer membrane protein assembly factor BamA n=1 Tax=Novosphingobium aromaticivorans (strain ATCC 700278 / DSM 12444 / CCUG 56034 / CIP 105152 / NBRC 16084 / F199) TaxID=279238 RepID=Q2G8K2_NOVAD|nr:outer membrane protein assembly factor BamA [Novosphingobium aromaticivorans]ABD25821.1 surface antigen (D15) [Novosphingobium aromaticivorans DSM 12444]SCY04818.1 Beta-barrel assembly machine subunit BamA [Novosphingobium aromaticivorans]
MIGRNAVRNLQAPGLGAFLLATTALAVVPSLAMAQAGGPPPRGAPPPGGMRGEPPVAPPEARAVEPGPAAPEGTPAEQIIKSVTVQGSQRLEPDTILSYIRLRPGQAYSQAAADQALKDLYATELFADVSIRNNSGDVVVQVKENPVINRIILEGNKRLKEDKILPEIKLAARQIFTRSKVRADVARIIELYKRQGRFAATVEPKMVMLDQNRVDIVFEISEGPKSKVRQINIIGNEKFSDSELRGEMVTKQARFFRLFSSGTSYDPDRLAFDQQKLRQFYLTEGYADFRVVSAVAELTPDKRDFIITYVVEEGERYKFGDVKVDSQIRDFDSEALAKRLPMKAGDWYNAKMVEDQVDALTETAGAFGYAFADVRPDFSRNKDDLTMSVNFRIAEAPRVYVERVDVNGNTLTQDKVVRREFRLAEGDAFNTFQIKRSTNRIKSLGYFQEKFEIEQKPGSAPDRIILEANVEERPTGELQLSAGFSSLESFIFQGSIRQNNFRGRGQTIGLSVDYSRYTRSVQVSFTEPYLFDKNISLGVDVYRRDLNSFNYFNSDRNTTYKQATTGFQIRAGVPLTEYMSLIGRYTFNLDDVTLSKSQFYADLNGDGVQTCEPLLAGRYLCDAIGKRTSSIIGASVVYDTLDNRLRPSRGSQFVIGGDIAGLGGSVKYARLTANAARFFPLGSGFIFSVRGEGGIIKALGSRSDDPSIDDVRLTDRFFLGEPQIRGFDIRGVGPRVLRKYLVDTNGDGTVDTPSTDRNQWVDDALGGKYYYLSRAELEIPLGSGARELGLRPSIYLDAGAVWGVNRPQTQNVNSAVTLYRQTYQGTTTIVTSPTAPDNTANTVYTAIPAYVEEYVGDTPSPRVSVGIGVNWNSPFGPFRLDFAKVLKKANGDDPKTFTFNVGTQF